MRFALGCVLVSLLVGCATAAPVAAAKSVRGPWARIPAVEMPAEDRSIPIDLLRDVADVLLQRPGARMCDPVTRRPIKGLSTEYCATVYVAGGQDALSWRVSEPVLGSHDRCSVPLHVEDDDHPARSVWVVGFIHNHPCGSPPSSVDLLAWPTDAVDPMTAMAVVRLVPGNPAPALFKGLAIEMASAVVAERQDGTRVYLRYFPTGEVEQWSGTRRRWGPLGTCAPTLSQFGVAPRCTNGPLRLLRE
ncbi:hypothetical protein OV207_34585 [Corallococcus sp. BB11-1]|uniref:hypothetical protein n=1 Tax=Corallococcus sp. BB11-1 TaxID=2996783 RepID=UPI00226EF20C|nr:hypothetical protein [Corallococcus sp. BB11-1]MCY1036616.1 hypothetical protein [Corallococcus sp. BB11-1]